MLILGIETSCDDTCAAVYRTDDGQVLSSVVSSQEAVHAKYGGIVPELASRRHLECILPVIEEALEQARMSVDRIEAVAVTTGPGLIGSLLIGLSAAKAIAYARSIPLVPVHHLQGHLISPRLNHPDLPYPHLGLVVSGGHSALYRVDGPDRIRRIGETRDDAAGEAFDKVGKVLGLPYPGGPNIEKEARGWRGKRIRFPKPRFKTEGFQFSFSGLKTAATQYVLERRVAGDPSDIAQVCFSFQETVIEILAEQSFGAMEAEGLQALTVCGGVAANGTLREHFQKMAKKYHKCVFFAERKYCTDNAAMIAAAGADLLMSGNKGIGDFLELNACAQVPLGS